MIDVCIDSSDLMCLRVGDRNMVAALDFTDQLQPSETLSSVSSVTIDAAAGGSISSPTVNTVAEQILSRHVAIGKAVKWVHDNPTAAGEYEITVTAVTSDGETMQRKCSLHVAA